MGRHTRLIGLVIVLAAAALAAPGQAAQPPKLTEAAAREELKKRVAALMKLLRARNADVRYCAAETLGEIGPAAKDAVPALIEALRGEDGPSLRGAAALALPKIEWPADETP